MPTCPLCQSQSQQVAWRYSEYTIFKCPACELQFADPLRGADLEYYRNQAGTDKQAILHGDQHPGLQFTVAQIERVIRRYLAPNQLRALDVGCGSGYLLAHLAQQGFTTLGIDFNPTLIQVANTRPGVHAQVSRVEDLNLSMPFDLVLLVHVLEHLDQPRELLERISRLITPKGILVIDLPNRLRFTINRTLTKGEWGEGEYPPHHLTFWSVESLTRALRSTGWQIMECTPRPFNSEKQVAHYLLNRFRLPPQSSVSTSAKFLGWLGQAVGLQGDTIFAVARRTD